MIARRLALALSLIATLPILGGCEAESASIPLNSTDPVSQIALLSDVPLVEPKVRFRRSLPLTSPLPEGNIHIEDHTGTAEAAFANEQIQIISANTADSGWEEVEPAGKLRIVLARDDDNSEYELEYDISELENTWRVAVDKELYHASSDEDELGQEGKATAPEAKPLGWSNGNDARVKKSISPTYPSNHRVLRRIGSLGNGCSAHLVGSRIVLTAAHCILDAQLTPLQLPYIARASGTQQPYGAPVSIARLYSGQYASPGCPSYSPTCAASFPNGFPGCFVNRTPEFCAQHDWAFLILPEDPFPNGHPGWMGYWNPSPTALMNYLYSNNDGYPSCAAQVTNAPANCESEQAYGQLFSGYATDFNPNYYHGSSPAFYRTSPDVSTGHSGSPNWSDYPGPAGPYSLGILVAERCQTCSSGNTSSTQFPNAYRSMTPYLTGLITSLRAQYP
jgi:hypothetical protein